MITFDPTTISTAEFHGVLLGTVVPRPIAFASTIDKKGNINLSPFSFFNAFGANPPILVFSPARRVRDNTTKHTLDNVIEVPEVAISIVSYAMVNQMSLSSTEYPKGVNEFDKSGFTEGSSLRIKPPFVKEAKASFECKVLEVKSLGTEGGAGNLIICEILLAHISEDILNESGKIDPQKLDAVGRLGDDWYSRASGQSVFRVAKPNKKMGIGFDNIPPSILNSSVLTGNELGKLASIESLPSQNEIELFSSEPEVSAIIDYFHNFPDDMQLELHKLAREYIDADNLRDAWKVLLQF